MATAQAEIAIRTDKGTYVGGETIYGSVYVRMPISSPCKVLRLQLRGSEISEFDYQYLQKVDEDNYTMKVSQRKARKNILKADIKLIEYPGGFPEGAYCYPFQYQLPHILPGVFHCRHEDMESGRVWEAVTKYSIGAFIDNTDFPIEPRLAGECPLIILDSDNCRYADSAPPVQSGVGTVRTFFCIQRGNVTVRAGINKSGYSPEENVSVSFDIENQSSVDTTGATVKLVRVIKLLGMDKSRNEKELEARTMFETLVEHEHTPCQKSKTIKCNVNLKLSDFEGSAPSSTSGSLIKCSYVVDVDVHVSWAPNIEVRQPLFVMPTKNTVWEEWAPPDWVSQCQQVDLTGHCSVPVDILSQSFSGIPGFQPLL